MGNVMITREHLEQSLAGHLPEQINLPVQGIIHAAVALIIRENASGLQVLFMQRAENEKDPWSGNISFPGGKMENGDRDLRTAAERETWEEVGIDLSKARFLGRLSDRTGAHLPILVSCFIYLLEESGPLRLFQEEVQDAFWVPLADLTDPSRRGEKSVRFAGQAMIRPGITLSHPGEPVLWGLTYLLVTDFITLLKL
ncbi:MAG: CoA pyrophosphatase [Deltaproteobacteria bacterium]|nr:CoA pyrophosphatase [Deltaproteobacteria bacterium]TLN03390.1 MAG: CoA pyrophosphatase [bacterium]